MSCVWCSRWHTEELSPFVWDAICIFLTLWAVPAVILYTHIMLGRFDKNCLRRPAWKGTVHIIMLLSLSLWSNAFKASQRAGKWGIIFFQSSGLSSSRKRDSQMWWRQRKGRTHTFPENILSDLCRIKWAQTTPLSSSYSLSMFKIENRVPSGLKFKDVPHCLTDISLALALFGTGVLWRNSAWLGSPFVMVTLSSFVVRKFRLGEPAALVHWLRGAFSSHRQNTGFSFLPSHIEPFALIWEPRISAPSSVPGSSEGASTLQSELPAGCKFPAERGCLKYQKLHTCGWFPYRTESKSRQLMTSPRHAFAERAVPFSFPRRCWQRKKMRFV